VVTRQEHDKTYMLIDISMFITMKIFILASNVDFVFCLDLWCLCFRIIKYHNNICLEADVTHSAPVLLILLDVPNDNLNRNLRIMMIQCRLVLEQLERKTD
jgi:hypothetical protein